MIQEELAALLESKEIESRAMTNHHKKEQSGTPRGVSTNRPPVQIHVHEDAKTAAFSNRISTIIQASACKGIPWRETSRVDEADQGRNPPVDFTAVWATGR